MNNSKHKILLSGGGTGGSVSPVLAISDIIRYRHQDNIEFFWVGTSNGPERVMVGGSMKYYPISNGKLRRYFSFENFIDPFKIFFGFLQSLIILFRERPKLVISAGSFVSVPLVFAAFLFRVPIIIYQLDSRPGLANKIMAIFSSIVLVTFEKSLKDYGEKAVHIGAFIRSALTENKVNKKFAQEKLGLRSSKPAVLIMGGGTGSTAINNLLIDSMPELSKVCQVVHITGKGKQTKDVFELEEKYLDYKSFEFLNTDGLIKAFEMADLVVSRSGMGMLIELSQLKKASIIIPMPDSHQEDNAKVLKDAGAAIILNQKDLNSALFVRYIKKLIIDESQRNVYSTKISSVIKKGDEAKLLKIINKFLNK